jgi:hypothetical protein
MKIKEAKWGTPKKKKKKKEDKCCLSQVQTPIEFILKQKIEYYKQNNNTTKREN